MAKTFNFVIDPDLKARLVADSDRTGAPLAETVRRAINEYLQRREADIITPLRKRSRTEAVVDALA